MNTTERDEQVEKAAKENCPRDLNFRKECDDNRCGAIASWKEGYSAGAYLVLERCNRLEEQLRVAIEAIELVKKTYGNDSNGIHQKLYDALEAMKGGGDAD